MKIILLHWQIRLLFLLLFSFSFTQSQAQDSIVCKELIRKGIDDMMNIRYASAIENLTKSQEMARLGKWPTQEFLSVNNLGLTYYKMMDYGKALTYYLEAYELAIAQKNPVNEMTVLNNIAIVYIKEQKKEQAESYFLKSYEIAKEQKLDTRVGYYATNLAQLNLEMKKFDVAEQYINSALPKLQNEPRVLVNARIIQNSLLLERKKYNEVIKNCLELLAEADEKNYVEEQSEIQLLLSKAYTKINQLEKALFYTENGLKLSQNNEVKIRLYENQSEIAFRMNLIEKVISSKDSIIKLTQLVNDTKNKELIENTTLRFELSESKHALDLNKTLNENQRKIYLLSIILLVLILIVLIVVFYKRNKLIVQKRIIDDNLLKIKSLELEQEKNNSELLKNEIESKNKMLSDKILFQTTRNELIEEIIETIANDSKVEPNVTLQKTVRDLKIHLKEDTRWEDFTTHFENVNNEFIQNLKIKHPDLNANDIRFLSFIYLNLNTKEIASLLNISPESCRKRKERLLKKLNLEADVSLYAYLSKIH